jgi:type I restriction-modification system DNA methylase subunit
MNREFKYSLEKLDMIVDDSLTSGLIPVQKVKEIQELAPEEIIALENATQYGAQYVYFRKFENRPSVPQVYLYDFTDKIGIEESELTILHKQLYSSGQVPMFFVFTKKDVRIFNCFERPADGKNLKYTPLTTIKLASDLSKKIDFKNQEEFKAFSGKYFDNGTFWENSKYSSQFKFSNSAYEKLLTELKQALRDIISQDILPEHFARRIMVVSILIKYLEEREDEKGNKVFPKDFFLRFCTNATKFTDVLKKKGAFLELLDYLAEHFNGGIFLVEDDERIFLQEKDLTRFGQFLDGDVEGIQMVFWRLYSFNDLPVELISNIYEEFLGKQPGVVYTPPYLVNFLLDEAMPLSSEVTDFKVLDPACGSGVFLVGAYRRLIYRWRKKNNWIAPDLAELKNLLRENIFGVELNKEAADLTVFSLSLALCDELTPLQIWQDLQFDDLKEENILHDDFFSVVLKKEFQDKFDLVIGNPPFEAALTDAARKIERVRSKNREITTTSQEDGKIHKTFIKLPDNQISLLFLEQSIELSKKGGLVCLIQPSGPLLYNNSSFQFRSYLFQCFNVPQVIDFSHLNRVLFNSGKGKERTGDVAVSCIFMINESSKSECIAHIIPKRVKPNKEKIYFQLDSYDFYKVSRTESLANPLVWKSNLFGGGRSTQLIKYLNSFEKLNTFLKRKKEENNWDYGEGFMRGRPDSKTAEYLTGKKALLAPKFKSTDIELQTLNDVWFTSPRRKSLFSGPLLLIKEVIEAKYSIIPTYFSMEDLGFDSRILGISSNGNEVESLMKLADNFKTYNQLYSYFITLTSSQFSVGLSSAFRADDIYNLPCFLNSNNLNIKLSSEEKIIINDTMKYLLDFKRKGENSKIATENATSQNLLDFGEIFTSVLRSVFKSIKAYQCFETDSYICFPFYFGASPNIDFDNPKQAEKNIEQLVQKNLGVSLRLTRIVRLYEGNVIYLIKPKKLRYWLKSIALRDADETFSDLRKQGY